MNNKQLIPKSVLTDIANTIRKNRNINSKLSFPEDFNLHISNDLLLYLNNELTIMDNSNITTVRSGAFAYCTVLKSVNLPLVTSLGSGAFEYCTQLNFVNLPLTTFIDLSVFSNCTSLKTVILRSKTMCRLEGESAFTSTPIKSGTGYIYVPRALVDTYKTNSKWSTYAAQFRAIEDYPDICGTTEEV
jgi:hypothetical protein